MWRVRAKRRGTADFDQLYGQNVRETVQETLDHLQRERATGVHDLRRDAVRAHSGVFKDDIHTYLARRASTSDYRGRAYNLAIWETWLAARLGASFKTAKITSGLVELALEEWKRETATGALNASV